MFHSPAQDREQASRADRNRWVARAVESMMARELSTGYARYIRVEAAGDLSIDPHSRIYSPPLFVSFLAVGALRSQNQAPDLNSVRSQFFAFFQDIRQMLFAFSTFLFLRMRVALCSIIMIHQCKRKKSDTKAVNGAPALAPGASFTTWILSRRIGYQRSTWATFTSPRPLR